MGAADNAGNGDVGVLFVVSDDAEIKRLVARCKEGDLAAMEALYLRYSDKVYAYALFSLGGRHEAEDLVQEVFVKILTRIDRYRLDPEHPFEAWLFRVVRNAILDARRRGDRRGTEALEQLREDRRTENGDNGAALESMLDWIKDSDLALFVERLPDKQRDVISLHYLLGWRLKEIAELLDTTPGAISELHRSALRTLEERMRAVRTRQARRRKRTPMLIRLRPRRVMVTRRFALGIPANAATQGASVSSMHLADKGLVNARPTPAGSGASISLIRSPALSFSPIGR